MEKFLDILFKKHRQVEDPSLLREFYALSYILFFTIAVHVSFFGYYLYIGLRGFAAYNIASIALHSFFLLYLNWRTAGKKELCCFLASLEVIAYSFVSTLRFGWDTGSQWISLAAVMPFYLFLSIGRGKRAFLTALCLSSLVAGFTLVGTRQFCDAVGGAPAFRLFNMLVVASALLLEAMMGDIVNKTTASRISQLQEDAQVDPLTGLWNRRFTDRLFVEIAQEGCSCSVVMLDIDFFKDINDTYGHTVGDEVLRKLAALLRGSFRSNDVVVRWGGEEFLIILRGATPDAIHGILENLRTTVENTRFSVMSQVIFFTITAGVAWYRPGERRTVLDAVEECDRYLYQGKRNGRNQVVYPPGRELEWDIVPPGDV